MKIKKLRILSVVIALLTALTALSLSLNTQRADAASTTSYMNFTFANRTQLGKLALPNVVSSSNIACLTAGLSTSQTPIPGCDLPAPDPNGSGALRLTYALNNEAGGVTMTSAFPTANGIDVSFDSYQYGGTGADGISLAFAVANPADPIPPSTTGPAGGHLGYAGGAAAPSGNGLPYGYLGLGLDNYGNFTNSSFDGSGCTDPAWITNINPLGSTNPVNMTLRGPGNNQSDYCLIDSTLNDPNYFGLSGSLDPATNPPPRSNALVPVEFAMNPSAFSVTTASGITVPPQSMTAVITSIGGVQQTFTDPIPTTLNGGIPNGLYPSSWINPTTGMPYLLFAGFYASTGGSTDVHEVNNLSITSLVAQSPVLTLSASDNKNGAFALGSSVTYSVTAGLSNSGVKETDPPTVNYTLPSGITPTSATGSGWSCSILGQVVTCNSTTVSLSNPLFPGSSLPNILISANVLNSASTSFGALTSNGQASSYDALSAYVSDFGTASPALGLTISDNQGGSLPLGGIVAYSVATSALSSGGSEDQNVTDSFTFSSGITPTSATGSGWSCSILGQVVTCISTNVSSVTLLNPGSSLYSITLDGSVSNTASTSPNALSVIGSASSQDATSGSAQDLGTGVTSQSVSGISLSPTTGPASGGATAIISGTGLKSATSVSFGTYTLPPCAAGGSTQCFIINSNGTLTVHTPPGTSGQGVPVSVSSPSNSSSAGTYTYTSTPILQLSITDNLSGKLIQGGRVSYSLVASASNGGAQETNPPTVTFTLPSGVTPTSAVGSNWSCSISLPTVTCVATNVSGTNPILPGSALSTITVVSSVSNSASKTSGALTSTGTVSSSDASTTNATDPGTGFASSIPSGLSLAPTSGPAKGGSITVISGTGLTGANLVAFGASNLGYCAAGSITSCFIVNSNGSLTVYTPPGTSGNNVSVSAVTLAGTTTAGTYTYTGNPALNIYAIDSANGSLPLGGNVTYQVVVGNSTSGTNETLPVTATYTLPSGLTATEANGQGWKCSIVSQTVTCLYSSLSNSNPLASGGSLPIISIGANVSVSASISGGALTSSGSASSYDSVTANSRDPGTGVASLALSSLSMTPTSGPASGGTVVVISGNNLSTATSINFGSSVLLPCNNNVFLSCFVINSDGTLSVYSPAGISGNQATVTVTNSVGTQSAGTFTYYAVPVLRISASDNQFGSLPLGGNVTYSVVAGTMATGGNEVQPITVTFILPSGVNPTSASGTNWVCSTSGQVVTCVTTNISVLSPVSPNSTLDAVSINASVSATASTASGALTSNGSAASSDAISAWTTDAGTGYSVPAPSSLSMAPTSGPAAGGGSTTISGTGLKGTTSVTFGTFTLTACASGATWECFVINSNGTLTVYAPPGSQGNSVLVSVTTPGGSANAGNYTYSANPVLTLSATDNQNGSLPLGGSVTYELQAGDAGSSGSDPNEITITYTLASGVTPTSAFGNDWSCTITGQIVICNSTNVSGTNQLQPGTALPYISILASISSTASTAANALQSGGSATANNATSASATDPGTGVTSSTPVLSVLTPTIGPATGGAQTTLSGTGLLGTKYVTFGTYTLNPCSSGSTSDCFIINSNSSLTIFAPPGTAGNSVNVTATTQSGTSSIVAYTYTSNSVAYETNAAFHLVYPINVTTNTELTPISGMSQPNGIVPSPDGTNLFVTNASGNDVSEIATATDVISKTFAVGSDPKGIAISPNGATLVVPNWMGDSVSLVNVSTGATTTVSMPATYQPRNAVVSPDSSTAYVVSDIVGTPNYVVSNITGYLTEISLTTDSIVGSPVALDGGPLSIAISPDGSTGYVANSMGNTVSIVNLKTMTVTQSINVPQQPEEIAISPDGRTGFVVCTAVNEVVPYDLTASPPVAETPISGFNLPDGIALDQANGNGYVANFNTQYTGSLTSFNVASRTIGPSWTTSVHSFQVAVVYQPTLPTPVVHPPITAPSTPMHEAFIANSGSSSVTPVNLTNSTSLTSYSTGSVPEGIVVTPNDSQVFVANSQSNTVTPYILSTSTTGSPISVGVDPIALAVTPDGSTVYVANYQDHSVTPIDTSTDTALPPITVGDHSAPRALAISPDGKTLYVATYSSSNQGFITIVSIPTGVITGYITIGGGLDGLSVTPNGQTLYVADATNNVVYAYATSTDTLLATITVGTTPNNIEITGDGSTVLVTNKGSGTLSEISTASNTVTATYDVGSQPLSLAIEPGNLSVLIGLGGSNSVVPVVISNGSVGAAVESGSSPSGIVVETDVSPVASFTESGLTHGSPTNFDASGSTSQSSPIATYSWNFGDTSTQVTSSSTVSHTYVSAGSYTVTLTVTDANGTSTTEVFIGTVVLNNGAASARAIQILTVG